MSNFKQFIAKEIIEALEYNEKYTKLLSNEKLENAIDNLLEEKRRRKLSRRFTDSNEHEIFFEKEITTNQLDDTFEVFSSKLLGTSVCIFEHLSTNSCIFGIDKNHQFVIYDDYKNIYTGSWYDYPSLMAKVTTRCGQKGVNFVNDFLSSHPNYDEKIGLLPVSLLFSKNCNE